MSWIKKNLVSFVAAGMLGSLVAGAVLAVWADRKPETLFEADSEGNLVEVDNDFPADAVREIAGGIVAGAFVSLGILVVEEIREDNRELRDDDRESRSFSRSLVREFDLRAMHVLQELPDNHTIHGVHSEEDRAMVERVLREYQTGFQEFADLMGLVEDVELSGIAQRAANTASWELAYLPDALPHELEVPAPGRDYRPAGTLYESAHELMEARSSLVVGHRQRLRDVHLW